MKLISETHPLLNTEIKKYKKGDILNIHDYANSMLTFMYNKRGFGLAANQLGDPHRIFVLGDRKKELVCINPEIIYFSKDIALTLEGCLSFPGLFMKVKRAKEIQIKYTDVYNNIKECTLTDLWAKGFQHELDHLNGITFIERVSKLTLYMGKKKMQKYYR